MNAQLANAGPLIRMAQSEEAQPIFWVALIISYLIAIFLMFGLWKQPDTYKKRLIWTLLLLFPFFGPIFYGGLYRPPKVQPKDMRAKENITYGAG